MRQFIFNLLLLFSSGLSICQSKSVELDALCKTYYKDQEPGASIAVEFRGKVIFQKSYGIADLQTNEKISAYTNFNIGSLTKQFTAYCILLLEQQGKLSLEDKLIKFFPDFNFRTASAISIRQLLTHSSGIQDHYANTDTSLIRHATDRDVLSAVRNMGTTYFVPGTQYRYSNTAYCLLALIIEKTSGLSYGDFIQKNIFRPLGMLHTAVFKTGLPIVHRAFGYDIQFDSSLQKKHFRRLDAEDAIFFSTEGDGGIYTSMADYLKWCHALENGRALDKALISNATSPEFEIDKAKRLSYGYGWFISQLDTAKVVFHIGSNGGFRAISFLIPSQQYAVIIFSNRKGVDLENLVQQINAVCGTGNNSFSKIDSLVSFLSCWPNFAPCKKIPLYSTSSTKSLSANVME